VRQRRATAAAERRHRYMTDGLTVTAMQARKQQEQG
jgi:hypothetical protein